MVTETKSPLEDYKLQGTPVEEVPVVGNLVYDDRGEYLVTKFNEMFRGVPRIEFTKQEIPKKGQPIAYSNVPRALGLNQILQEETKGRIRVMNPIETVRYWAKLQDKSTTYADTNSVSRFPNEGPNEGLRQRIAQLIGTESTDPLLVMALGVERADNDWGFTFTETDFTQSIPAPFLTKDQRVKYNPETRTLVSAENEDEGIYIWTPSTQDGLRSACRGGGDGPDFRGDYLLGSYSDGRVPVIEDPQGRTENLVGQIAELERERVKLVEEANSRLEAAKRYLKTGKFPSK